MSDALRLAGLASLFLGGSMFFFTFMKQDNPSQFAIQFLISPILIYLGFKLLL